MNVSRARRRWRAWDRWYARCRKLGTRHQTRGYFENLKWRARWRYRRVHGTWQYVAHEPVWQPAPLQVDTAGNTRPGFICVHPLENGRGPCHGNVFRLEDAIGKHICIVNTPRKGKT